MYGYSIFLGDGVQEETLRYMERMRDAGFTGLFTSLHIPEDDNSKYRDGLQRIGGFAHRNGMELVVDISGSALQRLGIDFDDLRPLQQMGVTGIRMDYGIDSATIARVSHQINVALNASTITEEDIAQLNEHGADFNRMEAWHNYYPRPETGLGKKAFTRKNRWLKEAGFQVMAFVPGDGQKRGPLHEGLPTLEKHRYEHPLAAALEMAEDCAVDKIYVGDPGLKALTLAQFHSYLKEQTLLLHADWQEGIQQKTGIENAHTNRSDAARDVIRSEESRLVRTGGTWKPENTVERRPGAVTVDNERYGRYQGEVQIAKRKLPTDPRVNVVAQTRLEDLPLLKWCGGKQAFRLSMKEREEWDGFNKTDNRNTQ